MRRERDAGDLEPIELTDAEAGIRPEDRHVRMPPDGRLIPRRRRQHASRAPALVVLGLVALLALAFWLRPADDDAPRSTPAPPTLPLLDRPTGTRLVVAGPDGLTEVDVDRGELRSIPVGVRGAGRLTVTGAWIAGTHVVDGARHAFVLPTTLTPGRDLGAATTLTRAVEPGGLWLVRDAPGAPTALRVEAASGDAGATVAVGTGRLLGAVDAGVLVESGGVRLVRLDGTTRVVATDERWLATAPPLVVTATACPPECSVVARDPTTGEVLATTALDALATTAAPGPDGRSLAVLLDGAGGIVLDAPTGAVVRRFDAPDGAEQVVWSPDGVWLLVTGPGGALEAIDDAGVRRRVDVVVPRGDVVALAR